MPMIDVYASEGTFVAKHRLAGDLATTLMTIEQVPNIPMFRNNTAAFVHELRADSLSNVNGDSTYDPRRLGLAGHANTNEELVLAARA
jgi:hypothetical protein